MNYLVLGSQGQIGLSLCDYLRSQGHSVRGFDITINPRHDLRVENNAYLTQDLDWCDFVFHLAWDVGGSTYLAQHQDSYDFISNNLRIATSVFDQLKRTGKPFLFASSQMASMSYSSYGLTKNLAERMVRALDGITVKFWNVYGIELDPDKTHVITDFINKARDTGVIDMRTDGTESRQMLHAHDCSRALYNLSQRYHELPREQEYHITSFQWNTMLEVAQEVAGHFPGTEIRPADRRDDVQKDAKNEPDRFILNYWQPEIDLSAGIAQIVSELTNQTQKEST
jgi:nucleoside-diphosphate-sugar epimerase